MPSETVKRRFRRHFYARLFPVSDGAGQDFFNFHPHNAPLQQTGLTQCGIGRAGGLCVFDGQSEGFGYAFTVCRVATVAVADMAVFDEVGRIAHGCGGVVKQSLFLRVVHQVEQGARLAEVVVIVLAVVPVCRVAVDFQRRFGEVGLLLPLAEAVGFVVRQAAVVAVGAGLVRRAGCCEQGNADD